MKSKLLTSLLVLLISVSAVFAGTTGKISGTVIDATTGDPLIGVNIIILGTSFGAASDLDGHYVILNVSPGTYELRASMIGFASQKVVDVKVRIDQTTEINFNLSEETLQTEEIVVIAREPIVKKGESSSGANLNIKEIENLPVVSVESVVGLQAGVSGLEVRGGSTTETNFMVNGISLKDGRDNTPYSNISFTSVEQVQIKTGGFNAEYGEVRSGMVNVVTKEGSKNEYSVRFLGRYSPAAPKHFGGSPHSANSYYMKPFLDDAVAWTGTENGAWDTYTQRQYKQFEGWNAVSERTLQNDDPNDDLTPEAARRLFLWQHRKDLDIHDPDYDFDASFGGPVPIVGKALGDMRFWASYKQATEMYILPLSEDAYKDYNISLKLTSDLGIGKKLMIEGHYGEQTGTNNSTAGSPGIFRSAYSVASQMDQASYIDTRMYAYDYWAPTTILRNSLGLKYTHVLDDKTFFEITANTFGSDYDTNPGELRDTSSIYKFGNNYFVDEGPYGFWSYSASTIDGMRTGGAMSTSRDSSYIRTFNAKFDITSQLDRYNNIKAGIEFKYTHNDVNYGRYDDFLQGSNVNYRWTTYPIQAALYVQDKLEFESLIANIGFRVEYSNPNSKWFDYENFEPGFAAKNFDLRNELIPKKDLESKLTISPRLGIAFPITVNSKLFFNYGHFRDLPTTDQLYRIANDFQGNLTYIANPETDLQKTVAYELGYEQNLMDEYLIRVTGYYKDISNEAVDIDYISSDGTVDYAKEEPNYYRDIRGFEATVTKNRGEWVQGFLNYTYQVTTTGKFGWGEYYENPTEQRSYERTTDWMVQYKPVPTPYARANIDLFTPQEYGPKVAGFHPLGDLRMNILASWQAGSHTTWTGGTTIPGIRNNVQWRDYYNVNLRVSKDFQFGPVDMQVFVQVNNLFNVKRLSETGFSMGEDRNQYFKSLHLPNSAIEGNFGYVNVPGEDKPGDVRLNGSEFTPIEAVNDKSLVGNPVDGLIYYDDVTGSYFENDGRGWEQVDFAEMQKILDDKSYIDMPNQTYFTFLNPRDVYWGIRFNVTL
ncbi:MAG: carboxypeptidase-like regulatory domain-containing protein [Melioribacteraceae bacterium]|nr:carboxypeptidase-like regulatory domain-containing protein [Melioribacteraceae bacterium]